MGHRELSRNAASADASRSKREDSRSSLGSDFDGYLESMPASTGAITSLLPPENATGNFVKIVQRLPVRIRFKPNQDGLTRLRPGMSVEPKVRVE